MVLRASPRIAWQLVAGEAILVDLDNGRAIGLNETGTFFWSRLESQDESQIVEALTREFDVDCAVARQDVRRFVALLDGHGFIRDEP